MSEIIKRLTLEKNTSRCIENHSGSPLMRVITLYRVMWAVNYTVHTNNGHRVRAFSVRDAVFAVWQTLVLTKIVSKDRNAYRGIELMSKKFRCRRHGCCIRALIRKGFKPRERCLQTANVRDVSLSAAFECPMEPRRQENGFECISHKPFDHLRTQKS